MSFNELNSVEPTIIQNLIRLRSASFGRQGGVKSEDRQHEMFLEKQMATIRISRK